MVDKLREQLRFMSETYKHSFSLLDSGEVVGLRYLLESESLMLVKQIHGHTGTEEISKTFERAAELKLPLLFLRNERGV